MNIEEVIAHIQADPHIVTLGGLKPVIQKALPPGYTASMGWGADGERALIVCSPRDPPYSYGGQVGRIFGMQDTYFKKPEMTRCVRQLLSEVASAEERHKLFRLQHPHITRWNQLPEGVKGPVPDGPVTPGDDRVVMSVLDTCASTVDEAIDMLNRLELNV